MARRCRDGFRSGNVVLERRLRAQSGKQVKVRITDNIHTMISFGRCGDELEVRLHRMFLGAPLHVLEALAQYIRLGEVAASRTLDEFIERHRSSIRRVPVHVRRRRVRLVTFGRHHDLEEIFVELNERWFGGSVDCAITWGLSSSLSPRRSIKLGSYSEDAELIRIHPALDQARVPRFFVAWIVHHEMLHHVHRAKNRAGRRIVHTSAFSKDERRFPDYERASAWERENLDLLLSWRSSSGESTCNMPLAHRMRIQDVYRGLVNASDYSQKVPSARSPLPPSLACGWMATKADKSR